MLFQLPLGPVHLPVLIAARSARSSRTIRIEQQKSGASVGPAHLILFLEIGN
jgi:hypothetical protein